MAQFTTGLINDVVGFDADSGPPNVCLVFRDEKANEYGVPLTPSALHKTIVMAMQALVESRNPGAFAEASLTDCKYFLAEDGRPSLLLQFDSLLEIAFPVTKAEAELIMGQCAAVIAQIEKAGAKGPPIQ